MYKRCKQLKVNPMHLARHTHLSYNQNCIYTILNFDKFFRDIFSGKGYVRNTITVIIFSAGIQAS